MKLENIECPKCKASNCVYNVFCISNECRKPLVGHEMRLLDQTIELWNSFIRMTEMHPDEREEVKQAVHQIQNVMSCRIVRKMIPGILSDVSDQKSFIAPNGNTEPE